MKPVLISAKEVHRLYLRDLMSVKDIAQHLECSEGSIRKIISDTGIPLRSPKAARTIVRARDVQDRVIAQSAQACLLFVREKMTLGDIAAHTGQEPHVVYRLLRNAGVNPKTNMLAHYPEFARSDQGRALLSVKTDFFKTWTPEMAWVLGLLYTDGHMSQDERKFVLTNMDYDVLYKVRELLGFSGNISRVNGVSQAGRLTICRKEMCEDLKLLGITPAKSFTIEWPAMPPSMVRHFVRGCWDGDGCFSVKQRALTAAFVSASNNFVVGMWSELLMALPSFANGDLPLGTLAEHTRVYRGTESHQKDLYSVHFSGAQAVEEFYHFLYDDVPLAQCMSRKRNIIESHLALRRVRNEVDWSQRGNKVSAQVVQVH